MSTASLTVEQASRARFDAAATRMFYETPRTVKSVLELATLSYAQSGRKATPAARKGAKRPLLSGYMDLSKPLGGREKLVGARYATGQTRVNQTWVPFKQVVVLKQHGHAPKMLTAVDIPENEQLIQRMQVIPHVKAGKNSWYGIMRALKKSVSASGESPMKGTSSARHCQLSGSPAIEIRNHLSYLLKIAPTVDTIARNNAAKQIEIRLSKQMGQQFLKW